MIFLALPFAAQADEQHPLCTEGVLLFREDFGGNDPNDPVVSTTPVPGMSSRYRQVTNLETEGDYEDMGPGCYLVTKQGYRNSSYSNYSVWHIMDDHTYPNDKTRGYMLEIDATSGDDPFYQTTLTNLYPGVELSFFAYVVNLTTAGQYDAWRDRNYQFPKLSFVISDPQTGAEIARLTTDTISHDWSLRNTPNSWQYSATWQPVGMNFVVPQGMTSLHLSIYNSGSKGTGNDFALDDIEVRSCCPTPLTLSEDTTVCDTLLPYRWRDILYTKPATYTVHQRGDDGCDTLLQYFTLHTVHCPYPPVSVSQDTALCDTLDHIIWRNKQYPTSVELHDTAYDAYGYDSVYYTLHISTYHCPYPPGSTISSDTTICDTLEYITWRGKTYPVAQELRDTVFDAFGTDSLYFRLHIDTVHCWRLYPIIVNKYNWVLLLDHTALRRYFPNRTIATLQWYRDEEPISGAIKDDYSETQELFGLYQLRLTLDGEQEIRSNTIDLSAPPAQAAPLHLRIYNSRGEEVNESQVSHGLYLYRYEQGQHTWTEKKIIR